MLHLLRSLFFSQDWEEYKGQDRDPNGKKLIKKKVPAPVGIPGAVPLQQQYYGNMNGTMMNGGHVETRDRSMSFPMSTVSTDLDAQH